VLGAVEAARSARRPTSPDHDYYRETAAGSAATTPAGRRAKLLKRSFHTFRELGDEALAPA
jgi:hypothetical protein